MAGAGARLSEPGIRNSNPNRRFVYLEVMRNPSELSLSALMADLTDVHRSAGEVRARRINGNSVLLYLIRSQKKTEQLKPSPDSP